MSNRCSSCKFMLVPREHRPCLNCFEIGGTERNYTKRSGPPSGGSSASPADADTLRTDIATAALVGLLCGGSFQMRREESRTAIAREAVALADALIEELKK